ncbi:MAG: protein phosphatase 2C domain-containing protein [Alphaproteobacteria bacterium]
MKKNSHHNVAISVKGNKNTKQDLPCQDFFVFHCCGHKTWGIVSDGAGSAIHAKIGAKIICNTINDHLHHASITNVKEKIIEAIEDARKKIIRHRLNKEKNLKDFAATLIGFFYHNKEGIMFHIGDGAGIGLDKEKNTTISTPHNGYFACETFFYTMDDWKSHLRFTKIKNLKSIFLLTDGITPFALDGNKLRENFLLPIDDYFCSNKTKAQKMRSLEKTLDNEKIRKLNSDDKTLLWCEL